MNNLIYIFILLAGFPTGYYLAYIAKDEIKKWRGRLIAMSIASLLIAIIISFISFNYKFPIILTLFFTIIVCLTIIWKSH